MQHTHRAECECALCLHVRAYRHRRRRTRRIRGRTLLNSCSSGLRLMFGKTHTTKLAYSGLNSLATCQSELERSGGHNTLTHIATAAWEYCCGAHTTLYVTLSSWVCSRGLAPNLAACLDRYSSTMESSQIVCSRRRTYRRSSTGLWRRSGAASAPVRRVSASRTVRQRCAFSCKRPSLFSAESSAAPGP